MTSGIPEGLHNWASNKYTSWTSKEEWNKTYNSWTSQEEWNKTYNSWTSKKEWDQWYTGSRLESCAQGTKVAGTLACHFTAILLEAPFQMAGDIVTAAIPTAQKATKIFQHYAMKAHAHFFSRLEQQDSWIIAWFKSIGWGVSQFFVTVWTFIKSPFIFHP